MKRTSRLTALAAALAGLVAAPAAQAATKVNMGVSIPAATHGFTGAVVYWANQAKKDLEKKYPGTKLTIRTAGGPPEQANQLQDLVTVTKIDTLLVFPFESASLTKPVFNVKSKGVYTVVVDRGVTDKAAQDAYIGGDNAMFGRIAGEYMAKSMGGKGNVLALRGIPCELDNERYNAWKEAIDKDTQVKILDAKFGNWNRDDAFKVTQDYLTRFKEVDAIWAADDDMAVGVLKALAQAKRHDVKEIVGGAGSKGMIKTLMDGTNPMIKANVSYSPHFIYDAITMTVEARVKGEKLPDSTLIPSVLITKENAKQFYFPNSPY